MGDCPHGRVGQMGNGLTKEKLTQMGRNVPRLKKEPRWEKMNTDKNKMNPVWKK